MTTTQPRRALLVGLAGSLQTSIAGQLRSSGFVVQCVSPVPAGNRDPAPGDPDALGWDAGDYAACESGVQRAVAQLGGPVDTLISAAETDVRAMLATLGQPQWREAIKLNLGSHYNLVRAVLPGMQALRFGRIVLVKSATALAGSVASRTTGAGLHGFIRALAVEAAPHGITANLLSIGCLDEDRVGDLRIPAGRAATPEDLAAAITFLCGTTAGYVTGNALHIDGGLGSL